jgi:predicted transcriptional regulator
MRNEAGGGAGGKGLSAMVVGRWSKCRSLDSDSQRRMEKAFSGVPQEPRIAFASFDLLWEVLTIKRWHILKAMSGQGKLSIREIARRVGRDVKAVHGDVHALLAAGVIDRGEHGVVFPFEAVRVDVMLKAA